MAKKNKTRSSAGQAPQENQTTNQTNSADSVIQKLADAMEDVTIQHKDNAASDLSQIHNIDITAAAMEVGAPVKAPEEADDTVISSVEHKTIVQDDTSVTPTQPEADASGETCSLTEQDVRPEGDTKEPETAPMQFSSEAVDPTISEEEKTAQRHENAQFAFLSEAKDNNIFVDSLEDVTPDDFGAPPKKKKRDPIDVIIELFRKLIFWVAVVVFFVSGYQVVYKLYAYQQAEDIYTGIIDIFDTTERREDLVAAAERSSRLQTLTPVNGTREESAALTDTADNTEYNELFEMMKGQLSLLRNKNEEIVGWIRMEGDTEINYPVVQGTDNDYYLHYAYDGTYNPAGSIYLDYKNNVALSRNRHSIIYGHNMDSGSPMFANLLYYQEEGFWEDNRYIDIYTDEALYTFEVFAAYETSPSQTSDINHAWRMNFNQDEQTFLAWIDAVCARSDITPNVSIDGDARILTLSTCMNVNENRYVVHAVLVETVK